MNDVERVQKKVQSYKDLPKYDKVMNDIAGYIEALSDKEADALFVLKVIYDRNK